MSTPGITLRPIKLIDGGYEVNEVFFEDVRVPADQLVGEENQGWSYAKFLLGNERTGIARVGTTKVWLAEVKERAAKTDVGSGTLLDDPLFAARVAELENELLALELTAAAGRRRTTATASRTRRRRCSSCGQPAAAGGHRAAGRRRRPGRAAVRRAATTSTSPTWAQHAAPTYLNFRKTSIYGG